MRMSCGAAMSVIVAVGIATASASAGTLLETTGSWNGSSLVFPFGSPNTQTYGQTFVVPASDTVLTRFKFFLREQGPELGAPTHFDVRIMEWNQVTSRATGPGLFVSAGMQTSGGGSQAGFQAFDVAIPSLNLNAGGNYVAFFTSSASLQNGQTTDAGWVSSIASATNRFVYINNGTDQSAWTNNQWVTSWGGSLAYELEFTDGAVIPLPHAAGMGAMGLVGLGVRRRR